MEEDSFDLDPSSEQTPNLDREITNLFPICLEFNEQLLLEIFEHLDLKTVLQLRLLNKFWFKTMNSAKVWKFLCQKKNPVAFQIRQEIENEDSWKYWKACFLTFDALMKSTVTTQACLNEIEAVLALVNQFVEADKDIPTEVIQWIAKVVANGFANQVLTSGALMELMQECLSHCAMKQFAVLVGNKIAMETLPKFRRPSKKNVMPPTKTNAKSESGWEELDKSGKQEILEEESKEIETKEMKSEETIEIDMKIEPQGLDSKQEVTETISNNSKKSELEQILEELSSEELATIKNIQKIILKEYESDTIRLFQLLFSRWKRFSYYLWALASMLNIPDSILLPYPVKFEGLILFNFYCLQYFFPVFNLSISNAAGYLELNLITSLVGLFRRMQYSILSELEKQVDGNLQTQPPFLPQYVFIQSNDNFMVKLHCDSWSQATQMFEDDLKVTAIEEIDAIDNSAPILIKLDISGKMLKMVADFVKYHFTQQDAVQILYQNDLSEWDNSYLQVIDQTTIFELLLVANRFGIRPLLDVTCKFVANMIKGKTPEEIRKIFNIKNDFTPEEEEQIRKENEWCEER